jgi:hypothetical protein
MNPQARPFAFPTVSPSPVIQSTAAQPRAVAVAAALPFGAHAGSVDEERWNEWTAKGRREDAAFREKMRAIGMATTAAAILGAGVLWIITAV